MYTIDSCFEKIRQNTTNVCSRPSYRTVCKKPIVNRGLLTHDDYLNMLATPKGYKWQRMTLYYNQVGQENKNNRVHGTKKETNTYQQEMYNGKKSTAEKKNHNKKNLNNEQKQKGFNDSLSADANELGNELNKQLQIKDYLTRSNNEDEKNSNEKLKKVKADESVDLLMKKELLWLQSEKKNKREEKAKKIKSDLKTKQKAREEHKKKLDEMMKLKIKRKQIIEEKRNKEKSEKEKEEIVKNQALAEQEMFEQQAELRKKAEQNRRLQALKLEAERIIEEEEEWRNKINQTTALKMGYTFKSRQPNLSNENCIAKTGKKRFTQYIDNLLNEIKQKDQVFDSGNVMKQIIRKELNMGNKRQVKLKKQSSVCNEAFGNTKNTLAVKTKYGIDKYNLPKDITIKTQYGTESITDCQNKICNKSFEYGVPQKSKKVLTCKIHNEHRNNKTIFNNAVCCLENDINRILANMQNCQNSIQNSKNHNMWEQKIFK